MKTDKLVGEVFGRYELVEYLGKGVMAHVYKGFHQTLERFVAIKVLHPEFAADEELVDLFEREARHLAVLQHPNIVQVYDFDRSEGIVYTVMEYIDGDTLRTLEREAMKTAITMPLKDSIKIVKSVAQALSYAHNKKVIHRDVKPENIMVEKSGRVVLADFGFSKLLTGTAHISADLRGTPLYMSPEQGQGNQVSGATDIYALGVIFYEMITGKLPFYDITPLMIIERHIKEKPAPPREINPLISKRIEAIILKAMEKDPDDRFHTAGEFIEAVEKLKEGKTDHLPSASLSLEDTEPPSDPTNFHVALHFMNNGQILELPPEEKEFTLGRVDGKTVPDIDLTPYNAYEWGISRMHAKLVVENDQIKVIDLESRNGSRVGNTQLEPNQPYLLNHSDTLYLGRLKIQVLIYQDRNM